jgi:signal transduction histidine kinase
MDDETRRRCLEPFFTTKGERGTGLGLAMVYGMAQRHGAMLEIDSARGVGTTIRLLFPVAG